MSRDEPRALCLAGPTASGKTAVALKLAEHLPIEIVSVDSALVYRGMDIGTAKPAPAERAAVPHHLIDVIDPAESYSAARFVAEAQVAIDAIRERGRVPLLVGGTMLYFRALFDGLDELPQADPALRTAIEAEARERGWPALHAELARVDPATAARLPPLDAQRIGRALEVWRATGRPLSSFFTRGDAAAGAGRSRATAARWPLLSLEPAERGWLHDRIGVRFKAMLDAGFVEEVAALRGRGDLHLGLPSMRCVGYRQAWEALDEAQQAGAGADLDTLAYVRLGERGAAATRQLAKRQLTWLRSLPQRAVLDCRDAALGAQALEWARRALSA